MTTTATPKPRKKNKKPTKTNVIFVIDRSGSMTDTANDVRGGFNSYVEKLKGDGCEYSLSAIAFDHRVHTIFSDVSLDKVPELTKDNYIPDGFTALYDAIGHAFEIAKERWSTKQKPYGTDPVIVVIITDGEENSSRAYTREAIISGIKAREESGNWSFVYMGADQDAWALASQIGIAQGNTMSYAKGNTEQAFAVAAAATSATSRSSSTSTHNFFDNTHP